MAVQNETQAVGPRFPIRVYIRRGGPIPDLDVERRRETIYLIIYPQKNPFIDWEGIGRHRDRTFGPKTSHWEPRKRK